MRSMVLTAQELLASFKNETRILLHLMSKVDPATLDYRPAGKQRSMKELLQYLSFMGPIMVGAVRNGFNPEVWGAAVAAAPSDLADLTAAVEAQVPKYEAALAGFSDADYREVIDMFGRNESRGYLLVNLVLGSCAAYRMQLFLYLKACGREELNTMNLWAGVDGQMG